MMEARKRGTPRETDVENDSQGGDPSTPYSKMTLDVEEKDGVMIASPPAREDSHIRSLTKGLTWRFVASATTIIIAKIVTGETKVAFQIGFFEFFAKIMIYYAHERIWARIRL